MNSLLEKIIENPFIHAKWLNTLSYFENCGARKIASYEHPSLVKEEILKHAAEEFRHAFYLKKQLKHLKKIEDYRPHSLLGGWRAYHFLHQLELRTCQYLKQTGLKSLAYPIITYAIELRAHSLYTSYDHILKRYRSPIQVKSILLEEENHLKEIEFQLLGIDPSHVKHICKIEEFLFNKWIEACFKEISIK